MSPAERPSRPSLLLLRDQVCEWIEGYVQREGLGVRTRLPSEQELTEMVGASRNTVRAALARLESEGLVKRIPRQGTFVAGLRPGVDTALAAGLPGEDASSSPRQPARSGRPVRRVRFGCSEYHPDPTGGLSPLTSLWRRIIDLFHERHPGIRVRLEPFDNHALRRAWAGQAGALPDVVQVAGPDLLPTVGAGLIQNLNPLVADSPDVGEIAWLGALGDDAKVDTSWYGLPVNCFFQILFLRKSLFAHAGLPLPQAGWRPGDFLRLCREFRRRLPRDHYAFALSAGITWLLAHAVPIGAQRGVLRVDLAGAEVRSAMEFLQALAKEPGVLVGQSPGDYWRLFTQGRLAVATCQTRGLTGLLASSDRDVAIVPLPREPGARLWRQTLVNCLAVASDVPLEAWTFIRFLSGPMAQHELALGKGNVPATAPAAGGEFLGGPIQPMQALVDECCASVTLPVPVTDISEMLFRGFAQEFVQLLRADRTVEQTLHRLRLRQEVYAQTQEQLNKMRAQPIAAA